MQLKQANLVLAVSMTVVTVIVAIAAVLVVISFNGSSETRDDRNDKFKKFERTCQQDISPTDDNIVRMTENIGVVSNWYGELLADLGPGIVFKPVETASVFGSRREQVINGLRADAPLGLAGAKVVPEGFMFGFDAYREGKTARLDEVPRLMYQLELIDAIVREMYAAKILSISRVEREIFEGSTPDAGDALDDVVLVATPEVMYDERMKNLDTCAVSEELEKCRQFRVFFSRRHCCTGCCNSFFMYDFT